MAWGGNSEKREDDDDNAEEEELDEANYKTQKDAVLFAIDVSKSMAKPPPGDGGKKKGDNDSPLSAALKCAYQLMQQRIIAQPKDMMGVLLFGTQNSKFRDEDGRSGYPHCYLLQDLDIPSAEDVKALRALVEGDDEDLQEILRPSKEPVQMSNVLFCANQIFTTNAPNFGSRRLFIITDNDDPHSGDKQLRSAAAVRAKDLYDLGVVIELFPISHDDKSFGLSKFYEDIVYTDPAADQDLKDTLQTVRSGDGLTLLNSLISNINSKQTPKRSYFSGMDFDIAPGLRITVKGYQVIHRQEKKRSCYVWMEGESPQLAVGETTKLDADARIVEKSEVKKAYKFGGEYVYFNPEELKDLKNFGDKCLRVIGFKDRTLLPTWASVKKSVYIFPSEEDYVGSTRVFSALWQKMLKDNKMALAWHIPRKNANPILVAILASGAPEDGGTPYLPAGLWLYPLPFADDLRNVELPVTARCSNGLIDQMRPIVKNLQLPKGIYNPTKYPNPSLQWHYRILQAMALEEEVPESLDDPTIPKYKAIAKRVGGYIEEWADSLDGEAQGLMGSRAVKREIEDDEDEEEDRPKKRAKAAPKPKAGSQKLAGGMSNAQLKLAVENETLGKMTVAELKDVLASKGVSTAGKKAELVEKLEQWVEDNV
ncbi:SPOC like C-terminal domain-containing protein [Coniochaeta sp. 2T2.1]|nr:SPOC like C-terminal domain-containing protein [Coniochaeta sp. 2T2.1]